MPEQHAVVDGRSTLPFRSAPAARAAISAWVQDGTDIIVRCRVGVDRQYLRDVLVEFAMIAIGSFNEYRGVEMDKLERDAIRQQIEREIAERES